MTVSLADQFELVVGVDTHRDTHAAALCDAGGRVLAQTQAPATAAGYAQLAAWAAAAAGGRPLAWAIEGARFYGLGLARHLAAAGQQLADIDTARHLGKRRAGKADPIDAVRAARELLARPRPGQLRADGDREALRLLMCDRDNAVSCATTARNLLAAVLVTAPASVREHLRRLPAPKRPAACAALACPPGADRQTLILHQALNRLGQRITMLAATAAELETHIAALSTTWPPAWSPPNPAPARSAPPNSCCRGLTAAASTPSQPSPCCRAPHHYRPAPAAPTGTGSTGSATASSTAPCTPSPSTACATTHPPAPTSPAAAPKAKPTEKSAAASSAT
jgi:hypothetical protein